MENKLTLHECECIPGQAYIYHLDQWSGVPIWICQKCEGYKRLKDIKMESYKDGTEINSQAK